MSTNIVGKTLLNQFRVDAFIAAGGMGAVYKVWDQHRNVFLAMKVLHTELADDPSISKRFQREANALNTLTHPNIVPFYGLHHTQDFTFLLQAFVDGLALKDLLRHQRGKPLPILDALTYLKALCAALSYAHVHGVVHCDVKPGNVMIDRGGQVYLTDFGIARHAESTTTTLRAAGAPAYMAPEQIRGEPVTSGTDVYALGVLLFEMLTGQRPFRGDEKGAESAGETTGERMRYAHLHLPPPNPRQLNPGIPEALGQVIQKALAKEPGLRYQIVQELLAEACAATGLRPEELLDRVIIPGQLASTPIPAGLITGSLAQAENSAVFPPQSISQKRRGHLVIPFAAGGVVLFILLVVVFGSERLLIQSTPSTEIGAVNQTAERLPTEKPFEFGLAAPKETTTPIFKRITTPIHTQVPSDTGASLIIQINPKDSAEMVFIPAGEYLRGLSQEQIAQLLTICPNCNPDGLIDQVPQRSIYLNDFWIGRTEVTNLQFARFVVETGYVTTAEQKGESYVMLPGYTDFAYLDGADWRHPTGPASSITGEGKVPVTQMSWYDAAAYCNWVGGRLPTEAEWEKAARGEDGRLFPWGNEQPDETRLNFNLQFDGPQVTGSFPLGTSPYGAMDMAGNLWEWTADFYGETYYSSAPDSNPTGPANGEGHPIRGGSWASTHSKWMYLVTTTYRLWNKPFIRSNVLGFRCVIEVKALLPASGNSISPDGPASVEIIPQEVIASDYDEEGSMDSQGNMVSFDPQNIVDGDPTTAWRVRGDGVNDWLQLDFGQVVEIQRVGAIPGYAKIDPYDGTDRFEQNYVVRSVRLEFSDGSFVNHEFSYSREMQFIDIGGVLTTYVRIVILSTYPPRSGNPRYTTPVSEVEVIGSEK